MIVILTKILAEALIVLVLLRGILSFQAGENLTLIDRMGYNIKDKYLPASIAWLCLVQLLVFTGWTESMEYAKHTGNYGYVGVAVLVLWAWAFVVHIIAPFLAGFRCVKSLLISAGMMGLTACLVLVLL